MISGSVTTSSEGGVPFLDLAWVLAYADVMGVCPCGGDWCLVVVAS